MSPKKEITVSQVIEAITRLAAALETYNAAGNPANTASPKQTEEAALPANPPAPLPAACKPAAQPEQPAVAEPTQLPWSPQTPPSAQSVTLPWTPVAQPSQIVQPVLPPQPAQPVPTGGAPQYTLEQLMRAGADLMNSGKNPTVLFQQFGISAMNQLPQERYGEFATALRAMGARI